MNIGLGNDLLSWDNKSLQQANNETRSYGITRQQGANNWHETTMLQYMWPKIKFESSKHMLLQWKF